MAIFNLNESSNSRAAVRDIVTNSMPEDIQELLKTLNSYDYGYISKNKEKVKEMKNFFYDYRSSSISEFEKNKIGVCWDYVHYEANWFKKHKYKYETYYIQVQDKDNNCPSHTYLVFYLPNDLNVYYFESSWEKYKGIERFDNINQLHNAIKIRHIEENDKNSKCYPNSYFRNKYDASSKSYEHLSCGDYMERVSNGRIIVNDESTNIIKESNYGVPEEKKFPLPDEKHVLSAIKFFNYVKPEYEQELASNIKKKIKEFDMKDKVNVGDKNRFKKYWNESTISSESVELDAEVMKVYQYPLPSVMPYFTPDEMENMGVFSEDAEKNYYGVKTKNPYAKEWFDTYKATGDPGDNYLQKLLPVIDKKMKEPSYEHKQELLEWGWNPEIAFSEKVKPRMEQVREKILEQYGVTLVSLVEDDVDDPFKLASVNIAKMLRENKDIIIANRAMKVTDNCNFTIYTILDELKYSSKIHDGIIIGQIHYDSDIVKSDILSVAKAAIERTNEYLASKSQMYMIKDLIYDPDIAPENKQDIIFIKREMAGQTNIAESAKGGRTIEDNTPEVIDLTNKDQLDYEERNMLDSLDDMNDDVDNGISTIEGDKSTSDSNNELSND